MPERVLVSSASSRSISIRPSCPSFASSQKTIADTLQVFDAKTRRSRSVTSPVKAKTRICVSRLTMGLPRDSCGLDVPLHPDATAKSADKIRRRSLGREDSRDGLAVLRDHESIRFKMIEDRKALLLELCGC